MATCAVQFELELAPAEPSEPARASHQRPLVLKSRFTLAERIDLALELDEAEPYWRPQTRGDCAGVPRPCPFIACRHHLYLDVTAVGSVRINFPGLEPSDMHPERSCALDVAERVAMTGELLSLDAVGVALNMTREGSRLAEVQALDSLGRTHLRVLNNLR